MELKEELISQCRYYHGEEECPFKDQNKNMLWFYERGWMYDVLNKSETIGEYIGDYSMAGLSFFSENDGVPLSYKALLYNRYHRDSMVTIGQDAEDFKKFYNTYYY